jgi:hypothetical protein
MKRRLIIILTILLSFVYGNFAHANWPVSVGPYLGLKGGVNASGVPQGIKNGFTINSTPEIGISGYYPFVKDAFFGAGLDLSYLTNGFIIEKLSNWGWPSATKITYQYNYFAFSPYLYASGFILGFDIGLPLGGTLTNNDNDQDVESDDMTFLFNARIGGIITVYSNDFGRFNIYIVGSYALNGTEKDNYSGDYNFHPGQIWLGLNYMFNLIKKEE